MESQALPAQRSQPRRAVHTPVQAEWGPGGGATVLGSGCWVQYLHDTA